MNIVIWDIESSSSSTDFGSIIEIGGILVDQNLVEKEKNRIVSISNSEQGFSKK